VRRIGAFAVRFRYPIVGVWIAAAALSTLLLPSLSSVVNPDTSSFLPASEPSQTAARLAAPFQPPSAGTVTLVFARADGKLGSADLAAIGDAEAAVGKVDHVVGVRDDGVSSDGQAARAQVSTSVPPSGQAAEDTTDAIRDALDRAGLPAGLSAHATGKMAVNTDTAAHDSKADRRTEELTNLVVFVMLILVFGSILAPIVTLLPAVLVLLGGGALIGELSQHGWFDVSSVARTLFTVLVIGAGTDYGLFLILRMREEMEAGHDAHEAVRRSMAKVGESIATSGGIVILALLSLLLASFGLYYGMGPTLAIGVALLLLGGLTLMPALLAILGGRVFWPRRLKPGVERKSAWARIGATVVRRPGTALAAGGVLFAALAACAAGFHSAGFAGTSDGPSGSDSAQGSALLTQHFPSSAQNPTTVVLTFDRSLWDDPTPLQAAERSLEGSHLFAVVNGPLPADAPASQAQQLTALHAKLGDPAALPVEQPAGTGLTEQQYEGYRSLAQFVSADGRTAQLYTSLSAGPADTAPAKDAVPAVRAAADAAGEAAKATAVGVGGLAPGSYDVSSVSRHDLARIVPLVLVLIGVLLAVALRSLVAPLYLIVSVALSYFAALGIAVALFDWIGDSDGLNFVLPFLMFIFLMALGEDYNILVMTRIREEVAEHELRSAIATAMRATGTSVTSAGIVLAATFAVAGIVGSTSQVRQLSTAISLGVLLDTFLVRTLLVPAVAVLLGRWNWWPSKLSAPPVDAAPAAAGD
jgi:RND superfamily putative drug exporter